MIIRASDPSECAPLQCLARHTPRWKECERGSWRIVLDRRNEQNANLSTAPFPFLPRIVQSQGFYYKARREGRYCQSSSKATSVSECVRAWVRACVCVCHAHLHRPAVWLMPCAGSWIVFVPSKHGREGSWIVFVQSNHSREGRGATSLHRTL